MDRVPQASLGRVSVDVQVPFGRMECGSIISERLNHQWQQEWDTDNSGRKLYNIQPSVKPGSRVNIPRKDQIKLTSGEAQRRHL